MKVAILGAGGVGLGLAALVAPKVTDVCLWAPTASGIGPLIDGKPLLAKGVLEGELRVSADLDIGAAVRGAGVIIIAVPGNGHRVVMDLLVPHVRQEQLIAISSHMSLSALYLSRLLSACGLACPISAWATTATTSTRAGAGKVHVTTVRQHIVASTLRREDWSEAMDRLIPIFGDVFVQAPDLMAVTLTNVNPEVHLAVSLCNLTRMEYGEKWGSYQGISAAVGRLIETMDRERVDLAARLGLAVHTVQEHLHESFGLPIGSVAEMAAEQHVRRKGASPGPAKLEHRYVTEDVPFGIVPMVKFGRIAGADMSLHEAGLRLIDALYGRNFTAENDILPRLGIDDLSGTELLALCRTGYPSAA